MFMLNGQEISIGMFPNRECYIDMQPCEVSSARLYFKYEGDGDLLHLKFLKDFLDEQGVKTHLIMPYFPYSRMDRKEEARLFTLKSVAGLINGLNFASVTVWEPHSDVCVALLDRVRVVNKTRELALAAMRDILDKGLDASDEEILAAAAKQNIYLVYPDAGAAKRYSKQFAYDRVLECHKERDFITGGIKSLKIAGPSAIDCSAAIIVDDLCSKGGTFLLTASALKETYQVEHIYLTVTHTEDNVFNGSLLTTDLIDRVYTTDSILSGEHPKLKVLK